MTYLRTRTNIYEKTGETDKCYIVKCRTKKAERLLSKSEVIKESEELGELIDFIIYNFFNDNHLTVDLKLLNGALVIKGFQKRRAMYDTVKLGILTDTGIKFVAEINKETKEVELL